MDSFSIAWTDAVNTAAANAAPRKGLIALLLRPQDGGQNCFHMRLLPSGGGSLGQGLIDRSLRGPLDAAAPTEPWTHFLVLLHGVRSVVGGF